MTEQVTPQSVIARLNTLAGELDLRSTQLHDVELALDPLESEYTEFVDKYELGLLVKSEDAQQNYKLPSEALRLKKARAEMPAEFLGRYEGFKRKRKRLETRIRDIKIEIDAQRSILSALKVMEEVR